MYTVNKVGGIALVLGGLLNILRMAPIYLSEGVTIWNFPPHDLAGTLMVAGGSGWILSHIMAIISVPLMLVGGFALLEDLSAKGYRGLGFATLSFLSAGSVLYLVAAVADGLVLPYASEAFTEQLSQGSEAAALIIELIHLAATNYGGTMAMFFILTSGLMGLTLLRAYDQRFIGYLGVALATLGVAGYISGTLTFSVSKSFWTVGPLLFSSFAYLAATGWVLHLQKQKAT